MPSLFHADEEIHNLCKEVISHGSQYLILDWAEGQGRLYRARSEIPPNTMLAVYSGTLEQFRVGLNLNHSMAMGRLDF